MLELALVLIVLPPRKKLEKRGLFMRLTFKRFIIKDKNESRKRNIFNIEIIWGDAEKENGTRLGNESVDAVIVSNLFFK